MVRIKVSLLLILSCILIIPAMTSSKATSTSIKKIEFSVTASGGMGFTHDEYSGVLQNGGISYLYDNRGWITPNLIKLRNLDLKSVLSPFDFSDAASWHVGKNDSVIIYDAVIYSIQATIELGNGTITSVDYTGELFPMVMNCNSPNVCHFIQLFPNLVIDTFNQNSTVFASPFSIITITLLVMCLVLVNKTRVEGNRQDSLLQLIKKGFLLFVLANVSFTIQVSIIGTANTWYSYGTLAITIIFIHWLFNKKLTTQNE